MSRDDYFVISYKILKYLYQCLKKGTTPREDEISAEAFNIEPSYWDNIMLDLDEEGYIQGGSIKRALGGRICISFTNLRISAKGIQHIYENTIFEKVKAFLKDIKDMTPGI